MNIYDEKNHLRRKMIVLRKDIINKDSKSKNIINQIINLQVYQKANVIGIYKSLSNEVMMDKLIDYSLNCGKNVLLPKVVDNNIIFLKYHKHDKLERSSFNILEPVLNDKERYDDKIDLIIVPGLAFDKNNNRLGYGKGYYDRFIKNTNVFKIGVCFSEQLINKVPVNNDDEKMDMVITEKNSI